MRAVGAVVDLVHGAQEGQGFGGVHGVAGADGGVAGDQGACLVEAILDKRPDDAILGEEGGTRSGTSGVRWVIDPLDGTSNFLHAIPQFAISIAVQEPKIGGGWGEVTAGLIYQPVTDESYWAERGRALNQPNWVTWGDARLDAFESLLVSAEAS